MKAVGIGGYIISAILLVILLFQHSCSGGKIKTITKEIPGDTKFQTLTKTVYQDKKVFYPTLGPTRVSHDTVFVHDTIIRDHRDTIKAATACFAKKGYKDSIVQDDVKLVRNDTLYMNEFTFHQLKIENTRAEWVMSENKFKVFLGLNMGLSLDLKNWMLAPVIVFNTKSDAMYSASYDFVNKMPIAGIYWKFHIGK